MCEDLSELQHSTALHTLDHSPVHQARMGSIVMCRWDILWKDTVHVNLGGKVPIPLREMIRPTLIIGLFRQLKA